MHRLNLAEYAEDPLPDQECKDIAKSCAKYSLRNYSDGIFSERQKARIGRRWHPGQDDYDYRGRAHTVGLMTDLGYPQRDIGAMFGVSESTVRRDLTKYRRSLDTNRSRPVIP